MDNLQQRVLALAGLAQAAASVKALARQGQLRHPQASDTLIDSVLCLDSESTAAVYGGQHSNDVRPLAVGLQALLTQIGPTRDKDMEVTRYMVGLMHLERRLSANKKALAELSGRLAQSQRQASQFGFERSTVIANLASIYSDVVSPLSKPLSILGNPQHLQQPALQQQIRALLLAGLRSAVLWRQLGGRRRQFLFSRQRMVKVAQSMIQHL
ncbi:high frequency lysogenization protein HflD [Idiomarina xiamenensis]|uniref:High frequency lysogenization protein HflD homolog n=1 Tax=Idiomarina xiamenensis 10-D-4 TaxID=740709 RepID=K2LAZ4_9GAMM|nr:high frequency lysogenization protein HflD [Idiomarina xiamenensis]EKE86985.1 lysogenization regulator [Idiomarina xiamenensis 10-D-4]